MRAAAVASWAALAGSLAAAPAFALDPAKDIGQCTVQVWGVKDGLPSAAVGAVAQAEDGSLWIATLGGLVRYDGVRVAPVPAQPEARTQAEDTTRILPAHDGTIWLGSSYREPIVFTGGQLRPLAAEVGLPGGAAAVAWAEDPGTG